MRGSYFRPWVLAAVWGAVGMAMFLLDDRGPRTPFEERALPIVVVSSADGGIGSLRAAIFDAAYRKGRARIVLRTEQVVLRAPLPPVVNPDGVVIEPEGGRAVIDGSSIAGPILDLRAPFSRLQRVELRGAVDQAVLVQADGVRLVDIVLRDNGDGVYLVNGVSGVVIEDSLFVDNDVGLRAHGDVSRVVVQRNRFEAHRTAAIWAVAPTQLRGTMGESFFIRSNFFDRNRYGSLLINVPSFLEKNEYRNSSEVAIHLEGRAHRVHANRVLMGRSGINALRTFRSTIDDNEISNNEAVGLQIKGGEVDILRNRLYDNAYGILMLFGPDGTQSVIDSNLVVTSALDGICILADSPIVRANRVIGNRGAGVRILEWRNDTDGSQPSLVANRLELNAVPVRREAYREKTP